MELSQSLPSPQTPISHPTPFLLRIILTGKLRNTYTVARIGVGDLARLEWLYLGCKLGIIFKENKTFIASGFCAARYDLVLDISFHSREIYRLILFRHVSLMSQHIHRHLLTPQQGLRS